MPDGNNIWELIKQDGDNVDREHWAPIGGLDNGWIQVGAHQSGTCHTYQQLSPEDAPWKISGRDSFEVTGYVMCCLGLRADNDLANNDSLSTASGASETGLMPAVPPPSPPPASLSIPDYASYKNDTLMYEPILYDRSKGWTGQTHEDAVLFCKTKTNRVGANLRLCEYDEYCPLGVDSMPVYGYKEDVSLAPILNADDHWVGLGAAAPCQEYTSLNLDEVLQGIVKGKEKDKEEITRNVMCCLDLEAIETTSTVKVTSKPTNLPPSRSPTPLPTPKPTTPKLSTSTPSLSKRPTLTPTLSHERIWYDRSKGWSGQTYQKAIEFCEAKVNSFGESMMLCNYRAYCPSGEGSVPYGGYKNEVSWAPIKNGQNRWVGLDAGGQCKEYTTVYPSEPIWSITGKDNEEITRHVLCCSHSGLTTAVTSEKDTPTISSVSPSLADTAVQVASQDFVDAEFNAVYQTMHDRIEQNLKPVPHNRSSGWTGNTHIEALGFCSSRLSDSTSLCSFASLCPDGTSDDQPITMFLDGPIWVPIGGIMDMWVEIRDGGQCKVQTNLDKGHDVTRYVMCCKAESEVVSGVDGNAPFDAELAVTSPPQQPPKTGPPSAMSVSSPTSSSVIDTTAHVEQTAKQDLVDDEFKTLYNMLHDRIDKGLKPVPHNRFSGWSGSTYREALEFCQSRASDARGLCSFASLCPNGTGEASPIQFENGPVYAPIEGIVDTWVEIGNQGQCQVQTRLPKLIDVTRYALCCKEERALSSGSSSVSLEAALPQPQSSPTPPSPAEAAAKMSQQEFDEIYYRVGAKFHPVTFTSAQGWTGSTYGDALEFCAVNYSKIPCPYDAICPFAANGPPIGGIVDSADSAWAPIIDSANGWVQIGDKDHCVKHADLKPHPPLWGLDDKEDEGAVLTPRLVCCDALEESEFQFDKVAKTDKLTEGEEKILSTLHPVWFGRKVRIACCLHFVAKTANGVISLLTCLSLSSSAPFL